MGEVMFVLGRVPDEVRTIIVADAKERTDAGVPQEVAWIDAICAQIDREIEAGPLAERTTIGAQWEAWRAKAHREPKPVKERFPHRTSASVEKELTEYIGPGMP
jgi:hypothetical protein